MMKLNFDKTGDPPPPLSLKGLSCAQLLGSLLHTFRVLKLFNIPGTTQAFQGLGDDGQSERSEDHSSESMQKIIFIDFPHSSSFCRIMGVEAKVCVWVSPYFTTPAKCFAELLRPSPYSTLNFTEPIFLKTKKSGNFFLCRFSTKRVDCGGRGWRDKTEESMKATPLKSLSNWFVLQINWLNHNGA